MHPGLPLVPTHSYLTWLPRRGLSPFLPQIAQVHIPSVRCVFPTRLQISTLLSHSSPKSTAKNGSPSPYIPPSRGSRTTLEAVALRTPGPRRQPGPRIPSRTPISHSHSLSSKPLFYALTVPGLGNDSSSHASHRNRGLSKPSGRRSTPFPLLLCFLRLLSVSTSPGRIRPFRRP